MLFRSGPVVAIALTTVLAWGLDWQGQGMKLVGTVPQGLPPFTAPLWDLALWQELLVPALLISVVGFVESVSMGQMLAAAYRSAVMPEFISSLPLVAYDGTMRRRLRFESVAGQAHIKTGSLTGVRAIAGYLLDRQGRRHALVFFINHPNAAAGQPAMDALLRWVYEGGCEAGQEKATGTARGPRACRD